MTPDTLHDATSDGASFVAVPGGKVWCRVVGEGSTPLLLVHGGPGVPHDYLTPHDRLAGERAVVYYDQLGCGRSERPSDPSLWTIERSVAELEAVRERLDLPRVHLLGQSFGGQLVLEHQLRHPGSGVESIVIASGPASVPRYVADCRRLMAELPAEQVRVIERHEANGWFGCPEYQAAMLSFNKRHICRLDPWPDELERAMAGSGKEVYEQMYGPSELVATGTTSDWDVMDRLGEIAVPALVLGGRYDTCTPDHLTEIHRRLPDSELAIFERSSHMPAFEEPERYFETLAGFLRRVEGDRSPEGPR